MISNLANSVTHQILEKAIDKQEISEKYGKEVKNSWQIAKIYRDKINPVNNVLPAKDVEEIKSKIISRVKLELNLRVNRGYQNIDFSLVEKFVENVLKEFKVI